MLKKYRIKLRHLIATHISYRAIVSYTAADYELLLSVKGIFSESKDFEFEA